jgi:hypothetical protein
MLPLFTPRPSQAEILRYSRGRLGIAAVPGAGKTITFSGSGEAYFQVCSLQLRISRGIMLQPEP